MSRARTIIAVASGRRAKWAVVVFWLIIVAVAGPLSGKLTGAEKNDSSSWLPAKAESTKVLDLQSRFQSPNIFTAVVIYDRPSGLTSADRAKAVADAKRFAQVARAGQPGLEGLERRLGRGDQPARRCTGERRRVVRAHRRPAG
jgi:RND superfamily putative drug exporter